MPTKIFVNLPVNDLKKSIAFFTKLGYGFDAKFTNEQGTCMIIGENIFVMLLTKEFFKTFIKTEIADTSKNTESLICLSADSREEVDLLVDKVLEAGGKLHWEPQDHGFMYERSFTDLDGHIWEIMYMNMAAFTEAQKSAATV